MSSTTTPDKLLLSVQQAADALNISDRTLWDLTSPRGEIRAVKLAGRVLYPLHELRRWIDSQLPDLPAENGEGDAERAESGTGAGRRNGRSNGRVRLVESGQD